MSTNSNFAEDRKHRFFYGYVVVAAALLIMMISTGALYSFGVFFKPVLTEFGWTRAATSGAYSLCILFIGFLSIVVGRLNDRFGPRIVVTACGLLLGSGYLLMSQVSATWQLYLFYGTLVGIGTSGTLVPPISTVARWFVKRRGLMTGIAMSGIGLGAMIIPPLANWIISGYGWRTSYTVLGIAVLVLMIVVAQFLRRDPDQMGQLPYGNKEQEGPGSATRGLSLQGATRTVQFWVVAVIFLFFGVTVQAIIVHIVPHATDIGISAASAAIILAIIGGVSIAGRIIMGNAGDSIGNKPNIIICFALILAALLWLLFTEEVWAFYLFAVVFGFGYGGMASIASPMAAELFGMVSHGAILGAIFCGMAMGETIGPTLTGYIFDTAGGYQPAFLVCAALCITAIILALLLRPTAR
ncbi:MFS transporter [Chloroflexota bacterium]